jgi:hypothetical protein
MAFAQLGEPLAPALLFPPRDLGQQQRAHAREAHSILLFVQIQLMCGAVRIILLSVNASRDDLEPK